MEGGFPALTGAMLEELRERVEALERFIEPWLGAEKPAAPASGVAEAAFGGQPTPGPVLKKWLGLPGLGLASSPPGRRITRMPGLEDLERPSTPAEAAMHHDIELLKAEVSELWEKLEIIVPHVRGMNLRLIVLEGLTASLKRPGSG